MTDKHIGNFLNIFEQKIDRLKKQIKNELSKPKKDRSKDNLLRWLDETKKLKRKVKEARRANEKKCPHCGKVIE